MRRFLPEKLVAMLTPVYHLTLAYLGALLYRFPARRLRVIGVTGTKGKSTTVELISSMLEEAGERTAIAGTVRFKLGDETRPNLFKMTMPGRFFLQQFLREAADKRCTYAIIEMSSEGAKQFRHRGIDLDALVFTHLAPEHIESHGSLENYRAAKLSLGEYLARRRNTKRPRTIVANTDDETGRLFLQLPVEKRIGFAVSAAEPIVLHRGGAEFTWNGVRLSSPLPGKFNIENALAAANVCAAFEVPLASIRRALRAFAGVPGRVEEINEGQPFRVYVDYAHTPDSLQALYETFPAEKKICVLGGTGGGRDTWKRPLMGKIAAEYCESIILTDEDPYDEPPENIVRDVAAGIEAVGKKYEVIMDRREAIKKALSYARASKVVLVTGKGTDPYIMGKNGSKVPWSDARVVREELQKILRGPETEPRLV